MYVFFFFNDTATTEIFTLSLHDALPILSRLLLTRVLPSGEKATAITELVCPSSRRTPSSAAVYSRSSKETSLARPDRKSTRLNSSHANISYAVFCLKKKKKNHTQIHSRH